MLLRGLIGMVLRRIRLAQNRTLRDVAESARVSVPYLSEVERGRKEPSSELLAAICSALDLELSDLLSEVRGEIARDRLAQLGLHSRPVNGRSVPSRPVTSATSIRSEAPSEEYSRPGSVIVSGGYGGSLGSSVMVAA
jgi:transcriptional regulator with XRE-family HTH domain